MRKPRPTTPPPNNAADGVIRVTVTDGNGILLDAVEMDLAGLLRQIDASSLSDARKAKGLLDAASDLSEVVTTEMLSFARRIRRQG